MMKPTKKINNNLDLKRAIPYQIKSAGSPTIKDVDLTKRIVTGFYNSYNFFDSDYDVILKGAATKSINERGPQSSAVAKIKHLMFHDWTKLPGKVLTLEEKTETIGNQSVTGIYFETKMADTEMGNDALVNYQSEIYDNHSIGFRFLDGEWIDNESEDWDKMVSLLLNPDKAIEAGFAWFWKEIMLYEGSTVAFGANSLTPYLGVKDNNKDGLIIRVNERFSRLESALSKGTQSDDMMQQFEMEILQLKQVVTELFNTEPSLKSTLRGRNNKDTIMTCDACGNDFNYGDMTPDADGAYACPECNQLCMSKELEESLNISQLLKIFKQ